MGGKLEAFEKILKESLPLPSSIDQAAKVLDNFAQFTKSLAQYVEDQRTAPKVGAIPFFLTYFWQMQSPDTYPIYYRSMVEALQEYNIWSPLEKIGESYLSFYHLNHELLRLFTQNAGHPLTLWDVEHAFWFVNQPAPPVPPSPPPVPKSPTPVVSGTNVTEIELPDSYIPPVVGIFNPFGYQRPWVGKNMYCDGKFDRSGV